MLPTANIFGVLVDPTTRVLGEDFLRVLQTAARTLGLDLHAHRASTEHEIDSVFTTLGKQRAAGLVIGPGTFFNSRSEQLSTLALATRMPAIYQYRPFAAAGGLVSYGTDETEYYRLVGQYAGRILKGEKPAELPVVQGTRFELVINLKTAKALGLNVPIGLLNAADEVIE